MKKLFEECGFPISKTEQISLTEINHVYYAIKFRQDSYYGNKNSLIVMIEIPEELRLTVYKYFRKKRVKKNG